VILQRTNIVLLSLGVCILVLTWLALSLHVPGSIWVGTLARKDAVVGLILLSGAAYGGAVWLITHRTPPRGTIYVVVAIAVVLRISLLAAPPFMSSDINRYVWDGRVQAAGINPYAYIAADPHLAALRNTPVYANINRVNYAHTIYPPMAQVIFAAVGRISQTVLAMKVAMVALEGCGILAVLALLRSARLPAARVLIYAWNPLAAWAIAGNGHIDGAAIGLLGVAMWAVARQRQGLAGALLGGAILTKFLPIVVTPALWRRWGWKFPAAATAVIVVLYTAYSSVGWQVFGFLPDYTNEEGLVQGSGFWLLAALGHVAPLPAWGTPLYLGVTVTLLAGLAFVIAFRLPPPNEVALAARVALLAAATMAAMTPHYPWYFAWLALPCCLCCRPSIVWLSIAPALLYSDPWHDEILLPTLVYLPAAALAVMDMFGLWRLPRKHTASGIAYVDNA
jgi:hypothetical protein